MEVRLDWGEERRGEERREERRGEERREERRRIGGFKGREWWMVGVSGA